MSLLKIETVQKTQFRIADSYVTDAGVTIPCIVGQTSIVDYKSQNGYRYKKGFWNKVFDNEEVQKRIADRSVLGTIEHPSDDAEYLNTPYEKASHVILKCWVADDGNPYAQMGLLNNQHGNAIKALVDVGVKPGVSTRGLGNFGEDAQGQFVEDEGYAWLGFDVVNNPNFQTLHMSRLSDSVMASPLFKEVTEMYHLRDSADNSYNRDSLIREIGQGLKELTNKFNQLMQLN